MIVPVCFNPNCAEMETSVDGYCSNSCKKEHKIILEDDEQ